MDDLKLEKAFLKHRQVLVEIKTTLESLLKEPILKSSLLPLIQFGKEYLQPDFQVNHLALPLYLHCVFFPVFRKLFSEKTIEILQNQTPLQSWLDANVKHPLLHKINALTNPIQLEIEKEINLLKESKQKLEGLYAMYLLAEQKIFRTPAKEHPNKEGLLHFLLKQSLELAAKKNIPTPTCLISSNSGIPFYFLENLDQEGIDFKLLIPVYATFVFGYLWQQPAEEGDKGIIIPANLLSLHEWKENQGVHSGLFETKKFLTQPLPEKGFSNACLLFDLSKMNTDKTSYNLLDKSIARWVGEKKSPEKEWMPYMDLLRYIFCTQLYIKSNCVLSLIVPPDFLAQSELEKIRSKLIQDFDEIYVMDFKESGQNLSNLALLMLYKN